MAEEGFKRKLTAILSADVVEYSRMMRDDEDATIRTLTNYRSAMSNLIQKFRGHVVDTTGDNLLAEFTSVVDAVNCERRIFGMISVPPASILPPVSANTPNNSDKVFGLRNSNSCMGNFSKS